VPDHEDICKPGRPACNLSAMELSTSVIGVRSYSLPCIPSYFRNQNVAVAVAQDNIETRNLKSLAMDHASRDS